MSTDFLSADFLLTTPLARELFHDYATAMPIYDYHCHLPAQHIADNRTFPSLTRIWLAGDHYKWRAMRLNGSDEGCCSGAASDEEKFARWAATVPLTIGNPLYVWTHLELRRYFDIHDLLTPHSAKRIYAQCTALLATPEYSTRRLLQRMNVATVCTTDDPCDTLEAHRTIAASRWETRVIPTFRPDRALNAGDTRAYNTYLDALGESARTEIRGFPSLVEALTTRIIFFHANGCRAADHAMDVPVFEPSSAAHVSMVFDKVRSGNDLDSLQLAQLRTALMMELGRIYAARGWVMQLHIGAMRNNNPRILRDYGADGGCDSIGDAPIARPLAGFLAALDADGKLPKTVLYNLNPRDNELLATMTGNFFEKGVPGKMQFGPAWWFLDQRDGMERQLTALSSLGLLSRFIGMTTDSRSFLSFPRHEYFRRILCRLLGAWADLGEIPADAEVLGKLVADVCYGNAERYFGVE